MTNLSDVINSAISGKIFAIHTDTVYGLCAAANNISAIKKLIDLKTGIKPGFSLHLADITECQKIILPSDNFTKLSQAFFPGPVTLIARIRNDLYPGIQNNDKIGIRMPNCVSCLNIIRVIGVPIIATSANRTNELPATSHKEIEEFCTHYAIPVPTSCSCTIGIDSTVIDTTEENPIILRRGVVPIDLIQSILPIELASSASYKTLKAKLSANGVMEGNILSKHTKKIKLKVDFTDNCQCSRNDNNLCSSVILHYPSEIKRIIANFDSININFHGARIIDEERIEVIHAGPVPYGCYPYSNHDFLFQSLIMLMRAMIPIL